MQGIPKSIYTQLEKTLLGTGQFDNDSKLEAVFVDARISIWGDDLPQASSPIERARSTIKYLSDKYRVDTQESALVLFLYVLSDRINPQDSRHQELIRLAHELEYMSANLDASEPDAINQLSEVDTKTQSSMPNSDKQSKIAFWKWAAILSTVLIVIILVSNVDTMKELFNTIGSLTGPLMLVVYLAVVVLAMFRRSVKDEKGLQYVYNLFSTKLTQDQFFAITKDIANRIFWGVIVIFAFSILAFIVTTFTEDQKTEPPSPSNSFDYDSSTYTFSQPDYSCLVHRVENELGPQLQTNAISDGELLLYADATLKIEQILHSTSESLHHIEMTVKNSFSQDVLVKNIEVHGRSSAWDTGLLVLCHMGGFPPSYVISDTLTAYTTSSPGELELKGMAHEEGQQQFSYPVTGRYSFGCGSHGISFEFDTSIVLPANQYTSIQLTIPNEFRVLVKDADWGLFITELTSTQKTQSTQPYEITSRQVDLFEYNRIDFQLTTNSPITYVKAILLPPVGWKQKLLYDGRSLLSKNDYVGAEAMFEQALELYPDDLYLSNEICQYADIQSLKVVVHAACQRAVELAIATDDIKINNWICQNIKQDGLREIILPACQRAIQFAFLTNDGEASARVCRNIEVASVGDLALPACQHASEVALRTDNISLNRSLCSMVKVGAIENLVLSNCEYAVELAMASDSFDSSMGICRTLLEVGTLNDLATIACNHAAEVASDDVYDNWRICHTFVEVNALNDQTTILCKRAIELAIVDRNKYLLEQMCEYVNIRTLDQLTSQACELASEDENQ